MIYVCIFVYVGLYICGFVEFRLHMHVVGPIRGFDFDCLINGTEAILGV